MLKYMDLCIEQIGGIALELFFPHNFNPFPSGGEGGGFHSPSGFFLNNLKMAYVRMLKLLQFFNIIVVNKFSKKYFFDAKG